MANGDNTVDMIAPDGKLYSVPAENQQKAVSMGWKPKQAPSFGRNVEVGFAHSLGLKSPTDAMGENPNALSWSDIGSQTLQNLKDSIAKNYEASKKVTGNIPYVSPVVGAALTPFSMAASGVEGLASGAEKGAGDILHGRFGQGAGELLGTGAQTALGMEGESAAEKVPAQAEKVARGAARYQTQTGETFAEAYKQRFSKSMADYAKEVEEAKAKHAQEVAETGEKNSALEAKHKLELEEINDKHLQRVARDRAAHEAELAKVEQQQQQFQEGQNVKQEKFDFAHQQGPQFQRIAGMARQLGDSNLPKTFQAAKAATDARWNAFRLAMGDRMVPQAPVYEAIAEAEESILAGSHEKVALFREMLKDAEDNNPLNDAAIFRGAGREARGGGFKITDSTSASVKNRLLAQLSEEERRMVMEEDKVPTSDVPFDEARRTYSALNRAEQRALSSGHGDVYRAIKSVKDVAEEQVKGVIPDELKPRFDALKQDYSQFAKDWYNKRGPIYRLMNAATDKQRIDLISGQYGDNLAEALDRYTQYGADQSTAAKVRSLTRQIQSKTAPSVRPPEPVTVAKRTDAKLQTPPPPQLAPMPEFRGPEAPQYDLVKARLDALENLFQSAASPARAASDYIGGWRMRVGVYRRMLAKLLQDEARRRWIAGAGRQ